MTDELLKNFLYETDALVSVLLGYYFTLFVG